MVKNRFDWFNCAFEELRREDKEVTNRIKQVKKDLMEHRKLHGYKDDARFHRELDMLKQKSRHLNIARALLTGKEPPISKNTKSKINKKSVLEFIVSTLGEEYSMFD